MHSKDDINGFIGRITPYCVELYRRAHVIVANAETAKYVVQNVIVEAYPLYLDWQGRVNFRDGIYELVRTIALEELEQLRDSGNFEQDTEDMLEQSLYAFSVPVGGDAALKALHARLMREKPAVRRMLMLRYGCGLSVQQIAQALGLRPSDIRERMRLCQARLFHGAKKSFGGVQLRALETQLVKLSAMALKRQSGDVPEMSAVFQLFSENMERPAPRRGRLGRAVRMAVMLAGVLLCALLFWLIAVLLEPHMTIVPQSTEAPYEVSTTYSSYKVH